jgi:hypothetical protein
MYKTLVLFLVVVTSAVWLQAQAYPQTSPTQAPGSKTVRGCLQGSDGNYTLTADNGTVYQLTGNSRELKDHVGHQMEITGMASASNAASPSSASGAAAPQQATLEVKSMKHVAAACKAAAQ